MSFIEKHIKEASEVKLSLLKKTDTISKIVEALVTVVKQGGTVFSCGNGGSACDAMHLTEELVARYMRERPGIRAQHLLDGGTLTCWANDYNFKTAFSRQIETFCTAKDALIVFSTSGNSENILEALRAANEKGALTIALLGKNGGKAKSLAKIPLVVDSNTTARIQEGHGTILHIICEGLETTLFPEAK